MRSGLRNSISGSDSTGDSAGSKGAQRSGVKLPVAPAFDIAKAARSASVKPKMTCYSWVTHSMHKPKKKAQMARQL